MCVEAAPIVNFVTTNDYSSGNFAHINGYSPGITDLPYSESITRTPTHAGYDDTLDSAVFYGGATTTVDSGITTFRVTSTERIQVAAAAPDGGTLSLDETLHTLFIWQKPQFLNGQDSEPNVVLSGGSMGVTLLSGGSGPGARLRYVVKSNGNYLISEIVLTAIGSTPQTASPTNPASFTWYEYNPLSSLTFIGAEVNPGMLDMVTAVGVWVEGYKHTDNDRALTMSIFDFTVASADVIPEPGVLGMLLAGGGILFGARRPNRARVS